MLRLGVMPGHGGNDRGTTQNGVDEADFCLSFAREFIDHVHVSWPTMGAVLLRDDDSHIGLSAAAAKADAAGCNLVFLFHVNAGPDNLSGGLLMHLDADATARRVARVIHDAYPQQLRPMTRAPVSVPRDVETSDWRSRARNVLAPYRDKMMSPVLIELFYASNSGDVYVMGVPWTRTQVMLACLSGLAEANRKDC